MRVKEWLPGVKIQLDKVGIATARLDCLVLLEDATGKDRTYLLAHLETELKPAQVSLLDSQIKRRTRHEPLAYIRGKTEFYGREFIVDKRVLEPRPESETMIDMLKTLQLPPTPHIIDAGTGSGALGITAALEIPGSTVELIDIDTGCLLVARQNLELHKVTAQLIASDLLENMNQAPDVILANLPYVPDSHTINEAAMQEPELAIFGGPDGLDVYRRFYYQIAKYLQFDSRKPLLVLTEALPFQHKTLETIASKHGFKFLASDDFIQLFSS